MIPRLEIEALMEEGPTVGLAPADRNSVVLKRIDDAAAPRYIEFAKATLPQGVSTSMV